MSDPTDSHETDLPLEIKEQIDSLCLEFEDLWQRDGASRIDPFMDRVDVAARPALFVELVILDATYRRLQGLPCRREHYERQYPERHASVHVAFARLEELEAISDLAPGVRLGRYEIEAKIGTGAFATVYRAFDHELQRRVAVKSLRRDRAVSDESLARLVEEARTVARLSHPSIVSVHDILRQNDEIHLIMEFVSGRSLREVLARRKLTIIQAVKLGIVLCEALSSAHRAGFTHRDLKPSNILLDNRGKAFIADFGLAIHDSRLLARPAETAGSIPYMSPEQVGDDMASLDGRVDVWAVGVILYEILCGERPFQGGDVAELAEAIKARDPKPLRQHDPSIPAGLAAVCERCLRKSPVERYASAADVAAELRVLLTDDSSRSREIPSRLAKLGFRSGAALGVLLGAVVLLVTQLLPNSGEAEREEIHDKLAAIAIAFQMHHDSFDSFSQPRAVEGEKGTQLSWRVHLLPFLGHQQLYSRFRLDQSWDSPHNCFESLRTGILQGLN